MECKVVGKSIILSSVSPFISPVIGVEVLRKAVVEISKEVVFWTISGSGSNALILPVLLRRLLILSSNTIGGTVVVVCVSGVSLIKLDIKVGIFWRFEGVVVVLVEDVSNVEDMEEVEVVVVVVVEVVVVEVVEVVVVEVVEEVDMIKIFESNSVAVEEGEKVIGFVVVVPGAFLS